MPKSRSRESKRRKPRRPKGPSPQLSPSPRRSLFERLIVAPLRLAKRTLVRAFSAVAVVSGLLALAYPRLTVAAQPLLNPSDPFSAPFVVSNDGYIPLTDVVISCVIDRIRGAADVDGSISRPPERQIDRLGVGERTSTACPAPVVAPIESADVLISVQFSPARIAYPMTWEYRFVGQPDGIGGWTWQQQPVESR